MIRSLIFSVVLVFSISLVNAQERIVKVDFESNSFKDAPSLPFDKYFLIEGEIYKDVEYVEVQICNQGCDKSIQKYSWNRGMRNESEIFSMTIPSGLESNATYDFKIQTYKTLSAIQKKYLMQNIEKRVSYFLFNNFVFNGSSVNINNPNKVYNDLKDLLDVALQNQVSKNGLAFSAPTELVLNELKRHSDFKFGSFLRKQKSVNRDSVANLLIEEKVQRITNVVMSELVPFMNTEIVQLDRTTLITSVPTDKEKFSLPINVGMYAWDKSVTINNMTEHNYNFTLGLGFTIPFTKQSVISARNNWFDSFGYSMGVLISPIRDAYGTSFVTPGITLPAYTALGFRLFNIVRVNAGVLVVGEKGLKDFNSLKIVPTAALAIELNLWMGVKK